MKAVLVFVLFGLSLPIAAEAATLTLTRWRLTALVLGEPPATAAFGEGRQIDSLTAPPSSPTRLDIAVGASGDSGPSEEVAEPAARAFADVQSGKLGVFATFAANDPMVVPDTIFSAQSRLELFFSVEGGGVGNPFLYATTAEQSQASGTQISRTSAALLVEDTAVAFPGRYRHVGLGTSDYLSSGQRQITGPDNVNTFLVPNEFLSPVQFAFQMPLLPEDYRISDTYTLKVEVGISAAVRSTKDLGTVTVSALRTGSFLLAPAPGVIVDTSLLGSETPSWLRADDGPRPVPLPPGFLLLLGAFSVAAIVRRA